MSPAPAHPSDELSNEKLAAASPSSSAAAASSSSILKERRFKLSRACDRCRRRRIKCDEGHPCQACLSASAPCTFEEPGKRTHPHKSKRTATLEDRMHHLETLIQAIPPAVFAAGGGVPNLSVAPHPLVADSNGNGAPPTPFLSPNGTFTSGVPPPSLHVFPLINPSTHFNPAPSAGHGERQRSPPFSPVLGRSSSGRRASVVGGDFMQEETSRTTLPASYLYFDDQGYTRWQGETSGLPLLDLLVERQNPRSARDDVREATPPVDTNGSTVRAAIDPNWFPDRTPRRTDINPETLWRLITSYIAPDLMDSLVQCFLSTSYYILPFLHVPTFLTDYGNPSKWGEPGFGAFIVAICCLASRHMDDPRVRADPNDGISAGKQWFELFARLRTLPIADCPTLYTIQADLIGGVYAVGLGKLSRAAALLSEAITTCVDAGLHRSADPYDCFDPIEDEVRKRTFWCVYIWDKQLAAHFGRPPMIRLRDCDVGEPAIVDDEYISRDALGAQPPGAESRMSAFVCAIRTVVVLEGVVDIAPARTNADPHPSPFLLRATQVLAGGQSAYKDLREEEALLDEIHRSVPAHWAHSHDTLASDDVIRVTQAERLHCAEQFVRLLIHRHRFTEMVAERTMNGTSDAELSDREKEETTAAQGCALQIVAAHLNIATKGLMTYYGVHVIHQLTQAGRTLMAILLNCKHESLQHLIPTSLDALRSCVGLLRRFSGRYVCGLRSGDLLEEFCRLTQIPLEPTPRQRDPSVSDNRPPWIRPIRKKTPSAVRSGDSTASQHSSPEGFSPSDFFADMAAAASPAQTGGAGAFANPVSPVSPSAGAPGAGFGMAEGPAFMDTSGGGDAAMYMTTQEVMSFFSEASVDVAALFNPEFGPAGAAAAAAAAHSAAANGNGSATTNGGGVFPSSFKKMTGVTSP